jgi:sec-independent protein translocase protein TatA
MHYLLFFEFIGTTELLVVLFAALIIFGPRKLPEMGRSLGQALHQLRSTSNEFKRTWEAEALTEAAGTKAYGPAMSAFPEAAAVSYAEPAPGDVMTETLEGAGEATHRESPIVTSGIGLETGRADGLQLT